MTRDKFAGGDQAYLRDVQYGDPTNLTARANIHIRYGTAPVKWFPWVAAQVDWPDGGDVLEVGCGPGWLWVEGADGLPDDLRLTLTDLSPGMIAAARKRVAEARRIVVDARAADVQALPFEADSFDVVVANHMLYHVPEPDQAVAELARVLRPDGVLVAATNGRSSLREFWEIRAEVFGGPPTVSTHEVFGQETGRLIVERHFADVEWRAYADELRCTEVDDVLAFITSTPPSEDGTPEQIAALHRAIRRRMDAGDGVLRVTKDTGLFLCRRPRPETG